MNRFSLTRNDSKTERLWSSALGAKTCALQMPELAPLIRRVHGDVVLWVGDCQDAGAALEGCMIRHTIFAVQHQARGDALKQPMLQPRARPHRPRDRAPARPAGPNRHRARRRYERGGGGPVRRA